MISFTIAIPTVGRPTLRRTFDSILCAGLKQWDQVVVVGDGDRPDARAIVAEYAGRLPVSYSEPKLASSFGHPQRNFVYQQASTTHLLTIDDDDAYVPGALDTIRNAVDRAPSKPFMFRMKSQAPRHKWDVLWGSPSVFVGNVGTPMFVVPNIKSNLGSYGNRYEGDLDFMKSTLSKLPDGEASVQWREDVIVHIF